MPRRIHQRRVTDLNQEFKRQIEGAVTYRQLFISASQTGTGSAQNVAHDLGATPTKVVIVPQNGHNGAGAAGTQAATITAGTHTSTNLVVTCTAGATFLCLAFIE